MDKETVRQYVTAALTGERLTAYERQILLDLDRYVESVTPQIGDEAALNGLLEPDQNLKQFRSKAREHSAQGSQAESLKYCIFRELWLAICEDHPKYRKEVKSLQHNGQLLVAVVAGGMATALGLAVTVVAALTAAAVWLILKVGRNAFCERYSPVFK